MPGTSMHLTPEEKKAFGEGLREARERCGLTPGALAQKIKVNPSAIAQWEKGIHAPTLENAILLTRALNLSLPALLTPTNAEEAEKFLQKQRTFRAMREAAGLTTKEASKLTGLCRWDTIDYAWLAEAGRYRLTVYEEASLLDVYKAAIGKKGLTLRFFDDGTPRIFPTLKPEYAPKQEEPAHEDLMQEEPETPIIQMIPQDTSLSGFRQSIIDNLIRAAKVSTDPAVKKLADVLALIDEYEGERRCEGNQSTAA